MCQIFAGKSAQIRNVLLSSPGLIEDLYLSNSDGIGAMYPTSKGLKIAKTVPSNAQDARAFVNGLPQDDRNLVMHWRWKTSGNVDRDNAHPFIVIEGEFAMTHNGVIRDIDMSSDETACDTRHYIAQFIRPQLELAPGLLALDTWREMMGEHIGDNRFVFMDKAGEMYFVNKHQGYEHDGIWRANDYSFDPALMIPDYNKRRSYHFGRPAVAVPHSDWHTTDADDADALLGAVLSFDVAEVETHLDDAPRWALDVIFDELNYTCTVQNPSAQLTPDEAAIVALLEDEDRAALAKLCREGRAQTRRVAEVMCFYGDWDDDSMDDNGEVETARDVIEAMDAEDLRDALAQAASARAAHTALADVVFGDTQH